MRSHSAEGFAVNPLCHHLKMLMMRHRALWPCSEDRNPTNSSVYLKRFQTNFPSLLHPVCFHYPQVFSQYS